MHLAYKVWERKPGIERSIASKTKQKQQQHQQQQQQSIINTKILYILKFDWDFIDYLDYKTVFRLQEFWRTQSGQFIAQRTQ